MSEIFEELNKYDSVLAYETLNNETSMLDALKTNAHISLDLSIYPQLKKKFVSEFSVKSLPCLLKYGVILYPGEDFNEVEFYRSAAEKLATQSFIYIFMKGTVAEPKCKFSRQLLELLEELKYLEDYREFNILKDPDFRACLKDANKWDMYPQIYIDGNFFGGLDCFRDAIAQGHIDLINKKFN